MLEPQCSAPNLAGQIDSVIRRIGLFFIFIDKLVGQLNKRRQIQIGKIKIGGNIMQGTGKRIVKDTRLDTDSVITYAGTDVLEIREVNY